MCTAQAILGVVRSCVALQFALSFKLETGVGVRKGVTLDCAHHVKEMSTWPLTSSAFHSASILETPSVFEQVPTPVLA